jgi:adenosylhomocysteine nucleosidase
MKRLGIIGAMTVEVESLKNMMTDCETLEKAGICFCAGSLEGLPAVIAQCGVGKVNAALCVQIMCDIYQVTHIVNTGVAGSLCSELDIGDLVISSDAMYHDFDCHILNPAYPVGQVPGMSVHAYPADAGLISSAQAAAECVYPGHARIGRIASGYQFVCDANVKSEIIRNTGALCTEMEGTAIAHSAWRNGVPFVVIRAISDKADNSAEMDYPTFEAIAAVRCAAVIHELAKNLS